MNPLFTQKELVLAKTVDKLPCKCNNCCITFYPTKREIMYAINGTRNTAECCSKVCYTEMRNKKKEVVCLQCNNTFLKYPSEIKKSTNHFCSHSCHATYLNTHKTSGNRRSKLEIWVEEQLTLLYPKLDIHFNRKDTINSELDIYIPSLNLAIELNGIFHYEPIYGVDKLGQIKANDISKTKACHDAKIDLCIIDTSQQKYVKPSTSQKYLDVIINIINERL